MDIIYKALITILSVIILFSTGLSLTLGIADEIETNHYFTSAANLLADSHYNENVMKMLVEDAKEKGYELSIQVFGSTSPGSHKYAKLTLNYKFHLDLFGIILNRTKEKII